MKKFERITTDFPGLYLIKTTSFFDARGYFEEKYQKEIFQKFAIVEELVQENISVSKRGVLRGLHFQRNHSQGKLISVLEGAIYDVAVDLRKESPTYGKYFSQKISSEENLLLWIPEGFAHGFLSLEENTKIQYQCSNFYVPEEERGILWSDSFLNIDWKLQEFGFQEKDLIISEKDKRQTGFLEVMAEEERRILLLGAEGQLGKEFQCFFVDKKIKYIATDISSLDVTKQDLSETFMKEQKVSMVIFCASYNQVDQAEQEQETCKKVNEEAVQIWVDLCRERKLPFVIFSTSFVFDGEQEIPYTESDIANPLSVYGKTKYKGEKIALSYDKSLVIRTSWLFGKHGKNFCQQVLDWSKQKRELCIVDDQLSSPTYTKDLVHFVWKLLEKKQYGLYHMSNEGETSKYEQAKYILFLTAWRGKLYRAETSQFSNLAKRPKYSKLDSRKLEFTVFEKIPHWKVAIQEYLKEVGELL